MDSEDIRVVEFLPDFVQYKDKFYTDSKIRVRVTNEFIQLEIPAKIIHKWVIDKIVHITSCWDKSIQSVIVKIYADIDGVYTPGHKLTFGVGLPSWNRKLKEIKSLNDNYKSLWKSNIKSEDTDSVPGDTLPGHNGSTFEEDIPRPLDLVYPEEASDAVTITKYDFDKLQPGKWLSDTIIDFYLTYLRNEMVDPDERHRFHFFSSFFFTKMATKVQDPLEASKGLEAFRHVKKWTEKVDLFKKELIFMPIIYKSHWSLIVICNFGELAKNEVGDVNGPGPGPVPCVLHLDSLRNKHAGLKEFIHSYLREEWKSRASEDISSRYRNKKMLLIVVYSCYTTHNSSWRNFLIVVRSCVDRNF